LAVSPTTPRTTAKPAADRGGDHGGPQRVDAHRQHGAQRATPVHRQRGQKIERGEAQVDPREAGSGLLVDARWLERDRLAGQQQSAEKRSREHQVDRGSGEGDEQFVARSRRWSLEPGDAANR
jgi:hypothetical protein